MMSFMGYGSTAKYDDLLNTNQLTLDLLLDDDSVKFEVKANPRLGEFVSQPENLETLVRYVTDDPTIDADSDRCLKFPYAAVDVLTSNSDEVINALIQREDLLKKLFGFMTSDSFKVEPMPRYVTAEANNEAAADETLPPPPPPSDAASEEGKPEHVEEKQPLLGPDGQVVNGLRVTNAGLAQRVILSLIDTDYYDDVVVFLKQHNGLRDFISHVSRPAVTEVFGRLLSSPQNRSFINWLSDSKFFSKLLDTAVSEKNTERMESTMRLINDTLLYLCEAKDNENGKYTPVEPDYPTPDPLPTEELKPLINATVKNTHFVSTLLRTGLATGNHNMIEAIRMIVRFCSPRTSSASRVAIDTFEVSDAYSTIALNLLTFPVYNIILNNMKKISSVLRKDNGTLGLMRLGLVGLVADCIETGYTRLCDSIISSSVLSTVLKFFFQYPLNNFAQYSIYRIVIASFAAHQDNLRNTIIRKAKFIKTGIEKDEAQYNADCPIDSNGFAATFTMICQKLEHTGMLDSLISEENKKKVMELIKSSDGEEQYRKYIDEIVAAREEAERTDIGSASYFNSDSDSDSDSLLGSDDSDEDTD